MDKNRFRIDQMNKWKNLTFVNKMCLNKLSSSCNIATYSYLVTNMLPNMPVYLVFLHVAKKYLHLAVRGANLSALLKGNREPAAPKKVFLSCVSYCQNICSILIITRKFSCMKIFFVNLPDTYWTIKSIPEKDQGPLYEGIIHGLELTLPARKDYIKCSQAQSL